MSQVAEIARLALGPGKLKVAEYFYYRLFDDDRYSTDAKRRFLGKQMQDRILPAHSGAECHRHPGCIFGCDVDPAAFQGAMHHQHGIFEDGRRP